jgi:hypothetical protein
MGHPAFTGRVLSRPAGKGGWSFETEGEAVVDDPTADLGSSKRKVTAVTEVTGPVVVSKVLPEDG